MIVPMTRYSILVYHRDFAAFMERLQRMGLLDIRQEEVYSEKSDEEFYPLLQRIEKVLAEFKREAKEQGKKAGQVSAASETMPAQKLLHECETVLESKRNNALACKDVEGKLQDARIWRSFDKEELTRLEQVAGLRFVFAETALKNMQDTDRLQSEFPVEVVNRMAGKAYFVWVGDADEVFTSDSLSKRMGFTVSLRTAPEQPLDVLETEYARL
ncbi:MAG: hypothetical protein K2I87_03235, partial [Bacteroidales bacterium]|nr:hypothetical protein [Bacteroidales bacterium]